MAIVTFQRYERKFIITAEQYKKILPKILPYTDMDPYCQENTSYQICNIYYDTDQNDIIRRSIAKPNYKEKLRLRSYGIPENSDSIVYLELKKKIEKFVTKRRVALTVHEADRFISEGIRPVRENYLPNQIINEMAYFLSNNSVKPVIYISYRRRAYFAKENPRIRLTFDSEIKTRRDNVSLLAKDDGALLLPADRILMEIKVPDTLPLWFARLLSEEKIYMTSFSKYGKEYEKYLLQHS